MPRPALDWNRVRTLIEQLYINEGLTAKKTVARLNSEGFKCSTCTFIRKMKEWGLQKRKSMIDTPALRARIRNLVYQEGLDDKQITMVSSIKATNVNPEDKNQLISAGFASRWRGHST
jgi:hypothetical protein